jgi:hypothetical protein
VVATWEDLDGCLQDLIIGHVDAVVSSFLLQQVSDACVNGMIIL